MLYRGGCDETHDVTAHPVLAVYEVWVSSGNDSPTEMASTQARLLEAIHQETTPTTS